MIRQITHAAAPAVILCAATAAAQPSAPPERPVIVVTGEGRASTPPDLAVLRLGVQARAGSATAALDRASTAADDILAALSGAGVAEADLRTSELSLRPDYGRDHDEGGEVEAFVASNVVTARLRDLDALGETIDAAARAGANRIDDLRFEVSDPTEAVARARRLAVEDAARAAATLAEAADVPLGPVLRIDERGGGVPFPAAGRLQAESVPVARGEVDVAASVTITYALGLGAE